MYKSFQRLCERLLRIPPAPEPPPGDETCTRIFHASPTFYKYLFFLWGLKTALVLVIVCVACIPVTIGVVAAAREGHRWMWLLLLLPAVALGAAALLRLFALAVLRLDFEKRWYMVSDRSLRVREGVINVTEMTVNFANIQNLSVSQGPIQRLLSLADLQVETAGGGGASTPKEHASQNLHTARFSGVDNANEIRAVIQTRLRELKDSGLGDHEEISASEATPSALGADTSSDAVRALLRDIAAEAASLRAAVAASA